MPVGSACPGKMCVHFERHLDIHVALLSLAAAIICSRFADDLCARCLMTRNRDATCMAHRCHRLYQVITCIPAAECKLMPRINQPGALTPASAHRPWFPLFHAPSTTISRTGPGPWTACGSRCEGCNTSPEQQPGHPLFKEYHADQFVLQS